MARKITTTRIGYSSYIVKSDAGEVEVRRYTKTEGSSFSGWIARAQWTDYLYTDPTTKADAMAEAHGMLQDREAELAKEE